LSIDLFQSVMKKLEKTATKANLYAFNFRLQHGERVSSMENKAAKEK